MTVVTGLLPELDCHHNQLTCAFQIITCQCVVTETVHGITWTLGSKLIAQFGYLGESLFSDPNYSATAEVLENDQLSSNVSFAAELKSDLVTVECLGTGGSSSWSYPIFGLFFEICIIS